MSLEKDDLIAIETIVENAIDDADLFGLQCRIGELKNRIDDQTVILKFLARRILKMDESEK